MKNLFLMLISLVTITHAYAGSEQEYFWVEAINCGEFDPSVVGDACVLQISNDGDDIALVVDYDGFKDRFSTDQKDYEEVYFVLESHPREKLKRVSASAAAIIRDALDIGTDVPLLKFDADQLETIRFEPSGTVRN